MINWESVFVLKLYLQHPLLHPVLRCHGIGTSRAGTRSLSVPAVTPQSKTQRKSSGSSQGHSLTLTACAEPIPARRERKSLSEAGCGEEEGWDSGQSLSPALTRAVSLQEGVCTRVPVTPRT